MPPRRANARNVNARNANVAPLIPDQEASNAEFRNAIQMLAQIMTHQNNRVHDPLNENTTPTAARVRDFVRMNPPEFLASQTNEDPQNFLEEINKICALKDVAHIWYTEWKENRGENAAECIKAMLLGDMNISRLMTHAQQVEGDKLREHIKESKKANDGNYDYS
ncbi:uncharacterized protein [Solanum lycopersicum]|uniref:uncharacterized protein n=1 Tax=Solanum lycopersicum TaxID=4081 RepID=UPI00374A5D32